MLTSEIGESCYDFRASGDVGDLLKPLFLTLEPPNYINDIKSMQNRFSLFALQATAKAKASINMNSCAIDPRSEDGIEYIMQSRNVVPTAITKRRPPGTIPSDANIVIRSMQMAG